jgi:hypothetical protein
MGPTWKFVLVGKFLHSVCHRDGLTMQKCCISQTSPERMATIRGLVQSRDLPQVVQSEDQGEKKEAEFIRALAHGSDNTFRKINGLFNKDSETKIVKGVHMMCGLVGDAYAGARATVLAVALFQNVPILDMTSITQRALDSLTIQQIVEHILNTPSRTAILMSVTVDEPRMHKVLKRIAAKELHYDRRIVFCMTSDEASLDTVCPGIPRLHFPGTIDDKIAMLLYRVPSKFADPGRLRVVAEKLRDYAVFEPKIQRLLNTEGTPDEYSSSLHYQVVRRNGVVSDKTLDDFPSFEVSWRRSLPAKLQNSLVPSPAMTSSAIHRVFPVGVSAIEAFHCFQSVLPADLKTPYIMTVESQASEDACGTIAIVQETQHTVVHINLNVDPGNLNEVCQELKVGYRSVVKELSHAKSEITAKLEEMDKKMASLHEDIGVLKDLVKAGAGARKRTHVGDMELEKPICKKRTCMNPVTKRKVNGAFNSQCSSCNSFQKKSA